MYEARSELSLTRPGPQNWTPCLLRMIGHACQIIAVAQHLASGVQRMPSATMVPSLLWVRENVLIVSSSEPTLTCSDVVMRASAEAGAGS